MDELTDRVQNLPTELYDQIYDLVFTASPDTVAITHSYMPPVMLQVSQESRRKFAATYYGPGNVFVFSDPKPLERWLRKLDERHKSLIQKIIFTGGGFTKSFNPPLLYRMRAESWMRQMPYNSFAFLFRSNSYIMETIEYEDSDDSSKDGDSEDEDSQDEVPDNRAL